MSNASVVDVFRAVERATARASLRWYVFGAQAVLAYGAPRLTADVDVTIDPLELGAPAVLRLLAEEGIAPRDPSFADALASSRLLPLIHEPSRIAVDVVLAGSGIEQDFLARVCLVDLGGVRVPLLCVEDLIATKVVAGRRKDREDVLGILREQAEKLDRKLLHEVLALFDESLEEPRAVRRFEALERALARLSRPR